MQKLMISAIILLLGPQVWAEKLFITPGDFDAYRVELQVSVDGVFKKFQLDTGANATDLAPDEQTLSYPSLGKASAQGASGTVIECDVVTPAEIKIGDYQINSPRIRRCDRGAKSFNNLGLDVFQENLMEIDYKNLQLNVLTDGATDPLRYPLLRLAKGHLKMEIRYLNRDLFAVFDTGAEISCVDSEFVEKNPDKFKLISEEEGTDVNGLPVHMVFYEAAEIQVGDKVFKNVKVAAFDFGGLRDYVGLDTPFILGNNMIIQAKWLFDLKMNQWNVMGY